MKYAPYSFSKISTFFNCQKKFDFTYVNKIDIDEGYSDPTYFRRGRFLHSYIANRLAGGDGMLSKFSDVGAEDKIHLMEMAENTLENEYIGMSYDFEHTNIEIKMYLDKHMNITNHKSKAAFQGYIDYCAVQDDFAMIVDWKSGKYRENPRYDQLELYAIWLLDKHPHIEEFDLVFYYVEHDKFSMKTINRDKVESFKENLEYKINLIEETEEFLLNPSKQCIFCPYFNTCSDEFGIMV